MPSKTSAANEYQNQTNGGAVEQGMVSSSSVESIPASTPQSTSKSAPTSTTSQDPPPQTSQQHKPTPLKLKLKVSRPKLKPPTMEWQLVCTSKSDWESFPALFISSTGGFSCDDEQVFYEYLKSLVPLVVQDVMVRPF